MTQPNFRELAQELLHAYVWCIEEYMTAPAEKDALVLHARAALEATPPPEQKSSIDELIAGCKPLDPEMAEALTTDARWRLFGEDGSATPPPEPPTDEELLRLYGVATPCYHVEEYKRELDFVRAALQTWGK